MKTTSSITLSYALLSPTALPYMGLITVGNVEVFHACNGHPYIFTEHWDLEVWLQYFYCLYLGAAWTYDRRQSDASCITE
jgi:hypothetical protein